MKEEWLMSGAAVPVDVETTAALVAEIKRLIDVVGGMALAQPRLDQGPDYERGFVDGMQKQMQSSVDKAVNLMVNEALDKKAENARELGLDYEPIQCPICKAEDSPYPKCGCVTYVEEKNT